MRTRLVWLIVFAVCVLPTVMMRYSFGWLVPPSSGTEFAHSLLEATTACVAALTAGLLLMAPVGMRRPGVVRLQAIAMASGVAISLFDGVSHLLFVPGVYSSVVPWSWPLCATVNASAMIMSGIRQIETTWRKWGLAALCMLALACIGVYGTVWFGSLPKITVGSYRPLDAFPFILFLFAASAAIPKAVRHGDGPCLTGMWVATLPWMAAQIHMMMAAQEFGGHFLAGHSLRLAAYACVFCGIASEYAAGHIVASKAISELRQSNVALEKFANVMSHDLQQPLRSMVLEARMMVAPDSSEDCKRRAADIEENAVRMQGIIEGFVRFAKPGAGPVLEISSELVVNSTIKALGAAIAETGAAVSIDGFLPTVMASSELLGQVFQNLLANAIKFQRRGVKPEVKISAERTSNGWMFFVRDNGAGMTEMQARSALGGERVAGGHGLGLTIAKRIIEGRGGHLCIETHPDSGSVFMFDIPDMIHSSEHK